MASTRTWRQLVPAAHARPVGLVLALTGAPLNAHDAQVVNLADWFVRSEDKLAIFAGLANIDWQADPAHNHGLLSKLLRGFAQHAASHLPASQVRAHFDAIQHVTDGDSLAEVCEQITRHASDDAWMQRAAKSLAVGSPTSAALSWEIWRRSRLLGLADVFRMEWTLSVQCCAHPDFREGVRALLVDKDNARAGRRPPWPRSAASGSTAILSSPPTPSTRWPTCNFGRARPHAAADGDGAAAPQETTSWQALHSLGWSNMGGPMALNLLRAGHTLHVLTCPPARCKPWSMPARTPPPAPPPPVAAADDAVISMLPASPHVKALYLGENGVLANARPGALLIDSSTIASHVAVEVAQPPRPKGLRMIDAPVSAAPPCRRRHADLYRRRRRCRPGGRPPAAGSHGQEYLSTRAAGAGQTAKICNNMLLGILMAGTAEALALGVANGLDPKVLSDIMSKSSGRNWALEVVNPWPGSWTTPGQPWLQRRLWLGFMLRIWAWRKRRPCTPRRHPAGAAARNLYQLHSQTARAGWIFPHRANDERQRPSPHRVELILHLPPSRPCVAQGARGLPRVTDGSGPAGDQEGSRRFFAWRTGLRLGGRAG